MSKPKVIVTRRWPEAVERRLVELFDAQLNETDRPMSQDELRAAFTQADAVFPTVSDRIDAEVLGAEPLKARLCGNFGVGFNNIDIEAAKARGITVTNTPGVLTEDTADMMGTQVTGKTLGLIGFGRIGRALAERAHFGFNMDILFHDPYPPSAEDAKALGATACESVETVLERSDFVSLHTPAPSSSTPRAAT